MGKKVLIIDDELFEKKGIDLFKVIKARGHSYKGVDNVPEALEEIEKDYDLIILDIIFPLSKSGHFSEDQTDMGRRTGTELLKKIKSQSDSPIVVMLSARRPDIFEEMSKDIGAVKYLEKPIFPKDLWEEIKEYLED